MNRENLDKGYVDKARKSDDWLNSISLKFNPLFRLSSRSFSPIFLSHLLSFLSRLNNY